MAAPGQILAALAALAPDSQPAVQAKVSTGDTLLAPLSYVRVFRGHSGVSTDPNTRGAVLNSHQAQSMIKRARLRDDAGILRLGWLWVHGAAPDGAVELAGRLRRSAVRGVVRRAAVSLGPAGRG